MTFLFSESDQPQKKHDPSRNKIIIQIPAGADCLLEQFNKQDKDE